MLSQNGRCCRFRVRWNIGRRIFEPMRACLHDQVLGAILSHARQFNQFVDGEIGQCVTRCNAFFREHARHFGIHARQIQQRFLDVLDAFLANDGLVSSALRARLRSSLTVSSSNDSISSISLIGT